MISATLYLEEDEDLDPALPPNDEPMDQDEERDGVPYPNTPPYYSDASQVDNLTEFVFLVDLPKSNVMEGPRRPPPVPSMC